MIQLSYDQIIFYVFFGPILVGMLFYFIMKGKKYVDMIVVAIKNHLSYNKKMKEIEKMKANGEYHEWIEIPVSPGVTGYVCRKTGYCPQLNGFFDVNMVRNQEKLKKQQEEYAQYNDNKLAEIALKYNLTIQQLNEVMGEIVSIQTTFWLQKLEELKKEQEKETLQ